MCNAIKREVAACKTCLVFLLGDICIKDCILLRRLYFQFDGEQRRARNARDHGKQKEEARRLARVLLPAFLCAEIYIKRENSGKEAAGDEAGVQTL